MLSCVSRTICNFYFWTFPLERRRKGSAKDIGTDTPIVTTPPRCQHRNSYTAVTKLLFFTIICSISWYQCSRDNMDCISSRTTGTQSNGGIFIFACAAEDVGTVRGPLSSLCSKRPLSPTSIHPITKGSNSRLLTFGLVTDSHYDVFPAGEKPPWQPLQDWFVTQRKRTSKIYHGYEYERGDVAKDKMVEAVEVFNKLYDGDHMKSNRKGKLLESETRGHINDSVSDRQHQRMDLVVNLGDLITNNGMWTLKPIMNILNKIKAPHYHLLGNHDLRAHNDRFGKENKYQHEWIRHHMLNNGMSNNSGHTMGIVDKNDNTANNDSHRWHFSIRYPPFFRLIFIDSMVMEPEALDKEKKQAHILWFKRELQAARDTKHEVVIIFAHVPIGVATNILGPTIKEYDDIILAFFHGHKHKGGYVKQGNIHSVVIQGQVDGLVNAYAVVEVFPDRLEVTGFGRVTTRILPFESKEALARLHHSTDEIRRAVKWLIQHPPMNSNGEPTISGPWWESAPDDDAGAKDCYMRPDLRYTYAEPLFPPSVSSNGSSNPHRLLFRPPPPHLIWKGPNSKKTKNNKLEDEFVPKRPPLVLNIPNYRKPLIPYVEPNPGNTLLLNEVYKKWPKRVRKVTEWEAPVQLNDGIPQSRPVWLVNNRAVHSNSSHDRIPTTSEVNDSGNHGKMDEGKDVVPRTGSIVNTTSDHHGSHLNSSQWSKDFNGIFAPVNTYHGEGYISYDVVILSFLLLVVAVALLIIVNYRRSLRKVRKYVGSRR